jgi:iron complex outermembrane receptor protein
MNPKVSLLKLMVLTIFAVLVPPTLFAADGSTAAQAASIGTNITGTVTNAATNRTLEGARVVLVGSEREAITDGQGVYRFGNVSPGDVVLSVSYTGLDQKDVRVVVAAGMSTRQDVKLISEIYKMGTLTIAGEREGNAQAITLQRLSTGIRSVVSADAFGNLAGNPADLLVHLPGVEGQSMDGDFRYVRIRGMSQNLNTVTVNGNRAANAGSAGSTREYQFEQTNADAIERIEVVKSPTPDMDGDSIGGAVNMVTKSAFDSSPERRIRGSVGSIWRPFDARDSKYPKPRSYSLSYSEVFNNRFGVAVDLGYRIVTSLLDQSNLAYQTLPNGTAGPAYNFSMGLEDARISRARGGANVALDFKFNENIRFYFKGSGDKSDEKKTDYLETWSTNQVVAGVDSSGAFTDTGGIIPGYTDTRTAVRAVAASNVTLRPQYLNKQVKSNNLQFGAVHKYETFDFDYDIYKSFAETHYPGTREISFIARGIGFTIEKRDDPFFPYLTQTAGPDVRQLSSYTENIYNSTIRNGKDQYTGAAFNLTKRFDTAVPTWIKTGARLREQKRNLTDNSIRANYVGPDGVMGLNPATGLNDDNLAQFGRGYALPNTKLSRYTSLPYPNYPGEGRQGIDQVFAQNRSLFKEDVARNTQAELTGKQDFKESISSYYIMGNIDISKLSVMGGVRVETTKVEGEGALQNLTADEIARRALFVGTLTDAELRRRNVAEYGGRQKATGESRDVFPGLHFKYSPFRALVTRLSYATNIGRPSIGQLIPRTTVSDDTQTISTSNPSLRSQKANNFDFSTEYYFKQTGVVSVGLFLKEISRFIYTAGGATVPSGQNNGFGGSYAGYSLTTQYNGGFAKIKGIELNYNQQFTSLPGFWRGFGAYATYTRMQIEGNYESGGALATTSEIPGFNPFSANAGISYIRNRLTVRFQYNYTGRYLSSYNANQSLLWYTIVRRTLDIKTQYRITDRVDAYLDVTNVFNEPDSGSEFFNGRARNIKDMSPLISIGMNVRL